MANYIKEITPEMTNTVNDLIKRDFENATKEEIEAYTQFHVYLALHADDREQKRAEREKRIEISRAATAAETKASIEALNALADLAKSKLETVEKMVRNEQEESSK